MRARSLSRVALAALLLSGVLAAPVSARALEQAPSHASEPSPSAQAPSAEAAADSIGPPAPPAPDLAEPDAAPNAGNTARRSWLAQGSDSGLPTAGADAPSGTSTGLTIGAVLVLLGLAAAAIAMRFKRQKL